MRDPARPDHLNPAYDGGDAIHPNPAGYKAMGEVISLQLLK
jgi:lysophospholipase L1-like esterase